MVPDHQGGARSAVLGRRSQDWRWLEIVVGPDSSPVRLQRPFTWSCEGSPANSKRETDVVKGMAAGRDLKARIGPEPRSSSTTCASSTPLCVWEEGCTVSAQTAASRCQSDKQKETSNMRSALQQQTHHEQRQPRPFTNRDTDCHKTCSSLFATTDALDNETSAKTCTCSTSSRMFPEEHVTAVIISELEIMPRHAQLPIITYRRIGYISAIAVSNLARNLANCQLHRNRKFQMSWMPSAEICLTRSRMFQAHPNPLLSSS